MIELFIFDIAGTTVRDDGFVLRAFRNVCSFVQATVDDEWIRARMGLDKREVFAEMLGFAPNQTHDSATLASVFEESIASMVRSQPPVPLSGVVETFAKLATRGIKIGFTTGFSRETGSLVLNSLGWSTSLLVASDEVAKGRPAPDLILECMRRAGVTKTSAVGIAGDTPSDLCAGTNAGVRLVVGVGHGTHRLSELAPHPHTHLIETMSPLCEIIDAVV